MGCCASQPAATVACAPDEAHDSEKPSAAPSSALQDDEKLAPLEASLIQQKEVLAAEEAAYAKASEDHDAMQTLMSNVEEQLMADAKSGNRIAHERITKAREECSA